MGDYDRLEFVNRGDEIRFLEKCLIEANNRPVLVVIRSPSGFGKSSLTDQLNRVKSLSKMIFCIVDPSIRGRTGTVLIYDGFFLQRVAETINKLASLAAYNWPTLTEFLRLRKKKSIATKKKSDVISELPNLQHIYKIIYDYVARAFAFGRYAPEKLLTSDASDAIAICSDYAEYCLKKYALTIVLREVQHIDLYSLKTLLIASESYPGPNIIMEYTSENGCFEPEHQKLILLPKQRRGEFKLLDLLRLNKDHLEYLIRNNVRDNFRLTSDYYLSWDGNLRSIIELKFQVGIGQSLVKGANINRALSNLTDTVIDHIARLSSLEKSILALVLSHVEPIDFSTISSTIQKINLQESQSAISKALTSLENRHYFLGRSGGAIAIKNDTIANSLRQSQLMQGIIAISEKALREHYANILESHLSVAGFFDAVRQYFRLCARTKDVQGLVWSIEYLSKSIKSTQNQSIYIDVITSAIESDPNLYKRNHENLLDWAAELAYSASDWIRTTSLLSLKKEHTPYSRLMYACALQEIGRHDDALAMIEKLTRDSKNPNIFIAKRLVESIIFGCRGQHEKARAILNSIIDNEENSSGPLTGYAYRFFEIVDDLKPGLENLINSIKWFEKYDLHESKAYSQLAAAMLLARLGKTMKAKKIIEEAKSTLLNKVSDQHIILNNTGAVELLTDYPDFSSCCDIFTQALKFACDDFSELTITINLSLSYLGIGNLSKAVSYADKCWFILEDHDFADTNIYWSVCFNMSVVYFKSGDNDKAKQVRQFPTEKLDFRDDDSEYWKYRYGKSNTVPKHHEFLASKKWHPAYLSHWTIDLEGLNFLKATNH